jgi:hypothetical protein
MAENTPKKEKRDFKQEFLEMVEKQSGGGMEGLHNAITMEESLKKDSAQLDEAHGQGMSSKDILGTLIKSKPASSPFGFGGMSQENGQVTEQQPGILAALLSTLITGNPKTSAALDMNKLLKASELSNPKSTNLSPQEVASKVQQANEALEAQGLEGYQAGITGSGDITASRSAAYGSMTSPEEIQSVTEGIVSGITPPDLKSVSSFRDRSKISASLAKQGYDLNTAEKDWKAANKFYAGMNSTQQIRLRQAINSVQGSLGNLETLNDEYKRLGFTPANKAQLMANSKGVGKQAVLATEYLTSLGVIQDELSQVFMGGNSPTEKFLEQAQKIVRSDFTFEQLQGVIKQLKLNLKYRLNSIDQAEPYTTTHKIAEEGEPEIETKGWNQDKESRYQELLKKRGQ